MTCRDRVDEIHKLLQTAGIGRPYVLVGYSVGGLIVRLYARKYPTEAAGMVIVDHAFLHGETNPPPAAAPPPQGPDSPPVLISSTPIVLNMEDDANFTKLPERIRQLQLWAVAASPMRPTAETAAECSSEVETQRSTLGKMPLVVVSTTHHGDDYAKLQEKLLALSSNSKQLMAESSHFVEIDKPEVIVRAIHQVVDALK
jgi:pimeloyl-ACP methyl ester carboxylesterase